MGGGEPTGAASPTTADGRRAPIIPEGFPAVLPGSFSAELLFYESRATMTLRRVEGEDLPPSLLEESGCHVSGRSAGRLVTVVVEGPDRETEHRLAGALGAALPRSGSRPTEERAAEALSWTGAIHDLFGHWERTCGASGLQVAGSRFEAFVTASEIRVARAEDPPATGLRMDRRDAIEGRLLLTAAGKGRLVTVEASRWASMNPRPSPDALGFWRDAAAEACVRAALLLEAKPPPAMEAPALFTPPAAGVLLHEICGHLLEADLIVNGASPFAPRLNEKIAPELVTLRDDPLFPGGRVRLSIDDEGERPASRILIESGTLRGFLSDRRTAAATGGRSTGNARRESYRHPPLPRISNLVMDPGAEDPAGLLEGIARGILVERLGRGQVDPRRGEFRLEVESGRMIDGGEAGRPVAGAFIVGSCRGLLGSIDGVGNDGKIDPGAGVCIKEEQIVPVGQAAPSVRVSNVSIVPGSAP